MAAKRLCPPLATAGLVITLTWVGTGCAPGGEEVSSRRHRHAKGNVADLSAVADGGNGAAGPVKHGPVMGAGGVETPPPRETADPGDAAAGGTLVGCQDRGGALVPVYESVRQILAAKCLGCHMTQVPLLGSYEQTRGAGITQSINSISSGTMPPRSSPAGISESELELLRAYDRYLNPIDVDDCRAKVETVEKVAEEVGAMSDAGAAQPPKPPVIPPPSVTYDQPAAIPMILNNAGCTFCHSRVLGDVYSTSQWGATDYHRRAQFWETGGEGNVVTGRWLVGSRFNFQPEKGPPVRIAGGIVTGYRGQGMPRDLDGDGTPDFPLIDFQAVETSVVGTLVAHGDFGASVAGVHAGNLAILGTPEHPIVINGDLLVKGDLVIGGQYRGQGTIYVTGNAYVPRDLIAMSPAFPYSEDSGTAAAQALGRLDRDGLAVAAGGWVLVGDAFANWVTKVEDLTYTSTGRDRLAKWFPGGLEAYRRRFHVAPAYAENSTYKCTANGGFAPGQAGLELIDAFLYSAAGIAGIAYKSSYSIRGGVMAPIMSVRDCVAPATASPDPISRRHGRSMKASYIEYDHRLATGRFWQLQAIAPYFSESGR